MIVVMDNKASEAHKQAVINHLTEKKFTIHRSDGVQQTILGIVGERPGFELQSIVSMPGVRKVMRVSEPYKLAGRAFHPEDSMITINDVVIGGNEVVTIAGPCSIESAEQAMAIAGSVQKAGARILRGGAFKPRSSPYSFQGLGEEGLRILREAADAHGLLTVSEVMAVDKIGMVAEYADILQVGARNMQNYDLLRELGNISKPVILKRGLSATIEETLLSAEYIMAGGNYDVILCERGIRTFEKATRNTLDISAIPVLKQFSHLPVIVDPSHGVGQRDKIAAMSRAAIAAGADGLMIEVHNDPDNAFSDGQQSLYPQQFEDVMADCARIAEILNRSMSKPINRRDLALVR